MINIIENLLNNHYTKMIILISMIIYISVIDLPLNKFDKIIQTIFNSILGQLFILILLNHYLINKDYGISLIFIILYCFIIKIKMSNNIIKEYSETNKNEKNNLIYEKLSDLDSESSISNNIEESLSDKNELEYLDETQNTEINNYINNINHENINNDLFETEKIEIKGGNKKISDDHKEKEKANKNSKKISDLSDIISRNNYNFPENRFYYYTDILDKIEKTKNKIKKKEEKYLNILDNNLIYNEDDTKILDIRNKNKKEELINTIKKNKKLDWKDNNILDWKDNSKMSLEQWEKDIDKWMPTNQVLNDWSEMSDNMLSIKKVDELNNNNNKNKLGQLNNNKKEKQLGGTNSKKNDFLERLIKIEKKLNKDLNSI